ncbi:MAG: ABC transporter ATP-binding protein [Actinomycetota bacterium]
MTVIEVKGLHKTYRRLRGGKTVAVDGLDLRVDSGGVYGFLGPNGSGKTTTIRCLLGLAKPTSGTCRILGEDSWTGLHRVIRKVGSIVEAPAVFPNFSGRRNLELLAHIYGIDRKEVDRVLDTVGLGGRDKDLAKTYSLGMKQRLAIAAALLKDPELLILDEPANGLDPAGIREVRDLLRRLGAEGRTVFVSSHLLTEVQQICDHVAILSRGRSVAAGPVTDVLSRGHTAAMLVRVGDEEGAIAALSSSGMAAVRHNGYLRVEVSPADGARVAEALARRDLYPSELRPDEVDLETVFMELTGGEGDTKR